MGLKPLKGRQESSEALFEEGQENFWKTVIDTMMDGLLVVDVEGVILSVNLAMEHITGYTREDVIGTFLPYILKPLKDRDAPPEIYAQYVPPVLTPKYPKTKPAPEKPAPAPVPETQPETTPETKPDKAPAESIGRKKSAFQAAPPASGNSAF